MKHKEMKPPVFVTEFYKRGTNAEDNPAFERVRVKCPACGWDRVLRLRPNQSEVECVCGHRLDRAELAEHTMPLPEYLDAADRHIASYKDKDDG